MNSLKQFSRWISPFIVAAILIILAFFFVVHFVHAQDLTPRLYGDNLLQWQQEEYRRQQRDWDLRQQRQFDNYYRSEDLYQQRRQNDLLNQQNDILRQYQYQYPRR